MAGGLQISVRQIASYPQATVSPNDLVLTQQGGLGGPYAAPSAYQLISETLADAGPLGVGIPPNPSTGASQILTLALTLPPAGALFYNIYLDNQDVWRYLRNGAGGVISGGNGFEFAYAPPGLQDQPTNAPGAPSPSVPVTLMTLSPAGALNLPHGTLTVARDPGSAMEVATMQWVGNQTVASFNGRKGVVTLDACDIGMALGYPVECIATLPQVDAKICQAIQDLIHTYPAVWSWQGRVGDVWLRVDDMNWALNMPGAPQLILPTPPADATNGEAVNAEWVITHLTETSGLATEVWVTQQIAAAIAGTVTSFNGRQGVVSLQYLDVAMLGFAPVNGPNFSGIPTGPTANTGTSTAQLATTAFVMNTLTAISPGVITFNGRAGTVVLDATDINDAGGALLASPNFTGVPAAPTAGAGTATSQIATTAFVMSEIAATTAGVVSFNGRSGVVTLATADITAAGGAPNASPALTGTPTAPTAANGTNTQQLATTAFVQNAINAVDSGVTTWNGRSGAVSLTQNDVTAVGGLVNPSPALTGTPTSPTPAPTDNSTNIATTAFVKAALANVTGGALVTSVTPPTPSTGTLWWNTNDGQLYVWTGGQWVVAVNPPQPNLALYMPVAGGTFTGPVTLAGNATAALQPVTLQQLQAGYLALSGGTLTGTLSSQSINNTGTIAMGPAATAGISGGQLLFPDNTAGGTGNAWGLFANGSDNFGINLAGGGYRWQINGAGTTVQTGSATINGALMAGNYANFSQPYVNQLTSGTSNTLSTNQAAAGIAIGFFVVNAAQGSISVSGGSTNYNTSSDDRLKTNQADIANAGTLIDQLQPITFNWDADPSGPTNYGFSAQAVGAVFPQAVSPGEGNPGDENFMPWGMDASKLVPLLIAAVKSLRARVAALEANANLTPAVPVAA